MREIYTSTNWKMNIHGNWERWTLYSFIELQRRVEWAFNGDFIHVCTIKVIRNQYYAFFLDVTMGEKNKSRDTRESLTNLKLLAENYEKDLVAQQLNGVNKLKYVDLI